MIIKKNDNVQVEYTGKLEDGSVFDKSEKEKPIEFVVGAGQMIPGFDKAVEGMKLNESKTINITPEDAYGEIRDDLIGIFSKESMPPELVVEKGAQIGITLSSGETIPAEITEINGDDVTVDSNHPLSGKNLIFDIKIVGVNSH